MKHVVFKPRISEKSLDLASTGWYTFVVGNNARKEEITKAVNDLYGVTVTDVRTANVVGKERRVGKNRKVLRKSDWKKAFVRLSKGQKIDAFEVTSEGEKKT
ncbi:50S ribosomal protein L23 [Candidatus Gottesmanbacteria bacterium RIFCSPLOWO2_01_FULL_43_11b]|uniref:Large ribosomal subunit protein uL23 n=1 Tax=Candidatus Gottesmanbacteria bacterium RIFCSPLOWO2_01_FULL_43_11b TaxID=1798392 RepID=A0A1F6AIN2_9BACT|nr:MAG: 50S ribosomal protein L23 [Candidatus Gottesmanbacteria bacterium RIFCSPLOWO2_01_FULL_43_11b]